SAPGDTVLLNEAGRVAAIEPGPNRAQPVCPHFGACGGCTLQHIAEPLYRTWLAERIVAALDQHGVTTGEVMPAHLSPPGARRRASLRAVKKGGVVGIGFNAERSHTLVDIRACPVLHPRLYHVADAVRGFLPPRMRESQAVGVQMTLTDSGVDLLLTNLSADKLPEIEALTAFAEAQDLARLSIEGPLGVDIIAERRSPILHFDGVPVRLPPASFTQATADGEAALIAATLAAAGQRGPIADLFAGLGTFSLPLSRLAPIEAIDAAKPALDALERAARAHQRPVTAAHRDLFRRPLQPSELKRYATVVVDPPRAGAEAQSAALASSTVERVVMVSCNPNSFARDARLLADGGFRLERLWPVGQFLWSTHVELVAQFSR
ncbi:MAG: RNA methyltransferase, partial [Rhodocyclaceae bacterium]|nr:RNA methyltransferase [Rhodocyclaceae bacterium]